MSVIADRYTHHEVIIVCESGEQAEMAPPLLSCSESSCICFYASITLHAVLRSKVGPSKHYKL